MIQTAPQPLLALDWMTSLADPTRLRLLRLLERHELGVGDLCEILQMPQSTVSRHLKVLSDQGWCRNQRQGTSNLYRMTLDDLSPAVRKLWLLTREQTDNWPTLHQDQLRLERCLREKQSKSQAFFASTAGQWDKLRAELYGQTFDLGAQLALLPSGWTIADLGCGAGAVMLSLSRYVHQVIGVDQSGAMLKAARKTLDGITNVELRRGDLDNVPIDDGTCDGALCILVLAYLPEPQKTLREMARILKPGGKAVIVDLLPHGREDFKHQLGHHCMGFEPARMTDMLAGAGLGQSVVTPLPPEPDAKGPALFLATGVKT